MVRLWLLAVALLMVPLPVGLAQTAGEAFQLLTDPADDVQLATPAGQSGDPTGGYSKLDLRALSVLETALDFTFKVDVKDLDSTDAAAGQGSILVYFRHNDQQLLLGLNSRAQPSANPSVWFGSLSTFDEGNSRYQYRQSLPVEKSGNSLSLRLGRDLLADAQGAPPAPGRVLDSFWVVSHLVQGGINFGIVPTVSPPDASDRMPNTGQGTLVYPIALGITQTGNARLSSPEPFRASNGEASTFVYAVNASNRAEKDDVFELTARGAPTGWEIGMPGLLKIPAGQTISLPVTIRTAFAHQHGTTNQVVLELTSRSDSTSVGRVALGLRYPLIPQPAGHHNELYLHSVDYTTEPAMLAFATVNGLFGNPGQGQYAYFNTVSPSDDERDDRVAKPGSRCNQGIMADNDTVFTGYCWNLPLDPGLEMGLDFDLKSEGAYSIPISSTFPQLGGRLQGKIIHYSAPIPNPQTGPGPERQGTTRTQTIVAELLPSARADISAGAQHLYAGIIRPTEAGEFMAYEKGASLALVLEFRAGRPDVIIGPSTGPSLVAGGRFTLPLHEYEDRVAKAFSLTDVLLLSVEGDTQRGMNPAKTAVYNVTLSNADNRSHLLDLTLNGTNSEWARIIGATSLELASNGEAKFRVAVAIPENVTDGDRVDLILEAANKDVATARVLVRLVVIVDIDEEYADEAYLLPLEAPAKSTPAPSLVVMLGGLFAVVATVRRARRNT